MKKNLVTFLVSSFVLIVSLKVWAAEGSKKKITSKNAVIQLCIAPKGEKTPPLGCADQISLNSKSFLFDLDESVPAKVESRLNEIIGNYKFHRVSKTPDLNVVGYVTKEKGHFPNPMVEFEVFHILEIKNIFEIPVPR